MLVATLLAATTLWAAPALAQNEATQPLYQLHGSGTSNPAPIIWRVSSATGEVHDGARYHAAPNSASYWVGVDRVLDDVGRQLVHGWFLLTLRPDASVCESGRLLFTSSAPAYPLPHIPTQSTPFPRHRPLAASKRPTAFPSSFSCRCDMHAATTVTASLRLP